MKERKILITGASGFIGRHAVPYMSKHYEIDTFSLRGNIVSEPDMKNVYAVLYLTGIAHQVNTSDEEIYFRVNKEMARHFANQAKTQGVKLFVYISSVKVFGESRNIVFNEESICSPEDAYGISKWEAEKELLEMVDPEFTVAIVRPAVVYGSSVKGNIKKLVELTRKLPLLPFDGIHARRSTIYIDNLLAMIKSILEQGAGGIFIAADPPQSTSDIVREINLNLEKPKRMVPFPWALKGPIRFFAPGVYKKLFEEFIVDAKNSNDRLHFIPPVSFAEGIRQMMKTEATVSQ